MRTPLVRMEKRNISILAGLITIVIVTSALSILLTELAGNRVVGIRLPIYAKTSKGIGFGSSKE